MPSLTETLWYVNLFINLLKKRSVYEIAFINTDRLVLFLHSIIIYWAMWTTW